MQGKFAHKVSGGKLLKVSVECDGGTLDSVRINGDFFAHPEDSIERLELELAGIKVDNLEAAISKFVEKNKVKLYGISPRDVAYAIKEALK